MLVKMMGGGIKTQVKDLGKGKDTELYLMGLGVMFILLKTLIVQWSYNKIAPKLTMNLGNDPSKFVPLNFYESFLFVILIEFLF